MALDIVLCPKCNKKVGVFVNLGLRYYIELKPLTFPTDVPEVKQWTNRGVYGWMPNGREFAPPGAIVYQEHFHEKKKPPQRERETHMTDNQFNDPGGDIVNWKELNGRLLLLRVLGAETGINTTLGMRDAIRADVMILDGPQANSTLREVFIFPRKLQGQVRASIGGMVLGRLTQGTAKSGQNPPWELTPATSQEKTIAQNFLSSGRAQAEPPF